WRRDWSDCVAGSIRGAYRGPGECQKWGHAEDRARSVL
ncbi:uncharacterized protein METZ01_LOCUS440208, partial [marine metagenome]